MIDAPGNADTQNNPDPEQERPADPLLPGIAEVVFLAQTLSAYGRYLATLIAKPQLWRGFTTVARFFGTADSVAILPRIYRGLLRAAALQAILLKRAQTGRDLGISAPPAPRGSSGTPAARSPTQGKTVEPPLTFETMPSMDQIVQQVLRAPIGRTIAAICLDLAVSPSLCTGPFWQRLSQAIMFLNGNLTTVIIEFGKRDERFEAEEPKRQHLPWPECTRQGIHQALGGFFIGENPPDLFQPAPAATAGPC